MPPWRQPWENWRTRARERQGEAPCSRPAALHKTQDTRHTTQNHIAGQDQERERGSIIVPALLLHMKDETKLNLGKLCESGGTGEYGESSESGDSGKPGESRLSCSGSRRVMGGWNVDSGCHKISENVSIVWSKTSYSG